MKKNQAGITTRFLVAALVIAAVVGVSALAFTPTHHRNALARPLKSIQTDKATLFYAASGPSLPTGGNCVERVPLMAAESEASVENLKLIAAAF
jgi:hypothetical protein